MGVRKKIPVASISVYNENKKIMIFSYPAHDKTVNMQKYIFKLINYIVMYLGQVGKLLNSTIRIFGM